ncbi:MAG: hypothetical protein S0880_08620 [Actinomycetota bacterium]|nr:hypothetical protein [Actinomycetota bacterium]
MTVGPGPSPHELTPDRIRALLAELGARLAARGIDATLYLVGGAAMALEFDARRVTRDVDAVFDPSTTVRAEAEAMAAEHGLPRDWLNDGVRAWVPGEDRDAVRFEVPGLAVAVASARHLLAMKMAAFRPTDKADLRVLFGELGITSADEAADLALAVYGEHHAALPGRDELVLEAESILASMRRPPG